MGDSVDWRPLWGSLLEQEGLADSPVTNFVVSELLSEGFSVEPA